MKQSNYELFIETYKNSIWVITNSQEEKSTITKYLNWFDIQELKAISNPWCKSIFSDKKFLFVINPFNKLTLIIPHRSPFFEIIKFIRLFELDSVINHHLSSNLSHSIVYEKLFHLKSLNPFIKKLELEDSFARIIRKETLDDNTFNKQINSAFFIYFNSEFQFKFIKNFLSNLSFDTSNIYYPNSQWTFYLNINSLETAYSHMKFTKDNPFSIIMSFNTIQNFFSLCQFNLNEFLRLLIMTLHNSKWHIHNRFKINRKFVTLVDWTVINIINQSDDSPTTVTFSNNLSTKLNNLIPFILNLNNQLCLKNENEIE